MDEKKLKKMKLQGSLALLGSFCVICGTAFDVRLKKVTYRLSSQKVQAPVRIMLLTDLHGCYYGEGQKTLLSAIEKANPDVILLGGDIFDDELPYLNVELFLEGIGNYPTYYVTGNHEYWSHDVDYILELIASYDVTILDGIHDVLEINGQKINICGISDPDAGRFVEGQATMYQQLDHLEQTVDWGNYSVLLAHRPEDIEKYLEHPFDLVGSGHAHGGQWRIPGVLNGLYAPGQGLFPKYAGGLYSFAHTDFVVSRGLARETTRVPRIFNRPELVVIDVVSEK